MKKIGVLLLLAVAVVSCSSGEKTTEKKTSDEETYVFDAIGTTTKEQPEEKKTEPTAKIDSAETKETNNIEENVERETAEETVEEPLYFVQIGAFQTQEAAEEFVNEAKELLNNQELTITYSDRVNLFVVQLPPFKDKKEAEKVRNRLWRYDKFKDAFIVTEE